jgi:hypothetical protein
LSVYRRGTSGELVVLNQGFAAKLYFDGFVEMSVLKTAITASPINLSM